MLLRPNIELGWDNKTNDVYFSRLVLTMSISVEERDKELVRENFDPLAREFIGAIQHAVPKLTRANAVWGYLFAIGVAMSMRGPTGRVERLSEGECSDADVAALAARIIRFAAAGIRDLAGS